MADIAPKETSPASGDGSQLITCRICNEEIEMKLGEEMIDHCGLLIPHLCPAITTLNECQKRAEPFFELP